MSAHMGEKGGQAVVLRTRIEHIRVDADGLNWFLDVLYVGRYGGRSWLSHSVHRSEGAAKQEEARIHRGAEGRGSAQ